MISPTEKLSLKISRVRELTKRIRAYELRAISGDELPLVTAGSHLTVPVQPASGEISTKKLSEYRQYSICSNPNERESYEIAVQLEDKSSGSSQFIFDNFHEGMELECLAPANNFYLHADASPAILIAGGIGIAPIKAIAHTLALRGRRFSLHYAGRSKTEMAFIDELRNYFPRNLTIYPADEGLRLDIMHELADTPDNRLIYASGPKKMLDDIETCTRMLGISKDRIQTEHFSTEEPDKNTDLVIELAFSNKLINVGSDQPLLNAVRDAGLDVSFDCCVGDCGSCAVKILEGEADHRDHVLSDAQKAEGFICLCVSRAKSSRLVLAL